MRSVLKNANLSAGGHVILAARDKYLEALSELVKLASLQVSPKMVLVTVILPLPRLVASACWQQVVGGVLHRFSLVGLDLVSQTAFFTLDEEIKMTNRRVNALNNVSGKFGDEERCSSCST